jgi:ABC-type branched-subunit amino acid transport system substrate-binding protein
MSSGAVKRGAAAWRQRRCGPGATLGLLALLALTGCGAMPGTIKIGLVAPFEGRWREVGYDAIYAARLAVREVNESGGIGPYRVELVALDDGGDARLAAEAAAALAADPQVLVALGHWLPETTASAAPVYAEASLALLPLGLAPLGESEPALLPQRFREDYATLSPFDEVAGRYAGATYDALWLALSALRVAESEDAVSREAVITALQSLQYQGVTGLVFQPATVTGE